MKTVLLVEDDAEMQRLIQQTLKAEHRQVLCSGSATEAIRMIQEHRVSVILLDIELPDQDGFRLCQLLQSQPETEHIPVIFLTAREDITHKVTAFSLGAEDYIVKPFHPLELKSRVEARLKKIQSNKRLQEQIRFGALHLNLKSLRCSMRDEDGTSRDLKLSAMEFRLLRVFLENRGTVFSREQLLNAVWGRGASVLDRTVDAHVYGLRKKLARYAGLILSVPRLGYQFSESSESIDEIQDSKPPFKKAA